MPLWVAPIMGLSMWNSLHSPKQLKAYHSALYGITTLPTGKACEISFLLSLGNPFAFPVPILRKHVIKLLKPYFRTLKRSSHTPVRHPDIQDINLGSQRLVIGQDLLRFKLTGHFFKTLLLKFFRLSQRQEMNTIEQSPSPKTPLTLA